jgi:purine-binding chemotaxis protein CheW
VDLRLRFGCSAAEYNSFTVSIILHIGQRTIGTVVDSVSDVMEIPADSVRPAPDMNSAIDATFIRGLAQVGERMVILLDIESLLMSPDMGLVD